MTDLKVSDIIRITSSIAPQGLVLRETGVTVFLTKDDTIAPQERQRIYSSLAGVSDDFSQDSKPYSAASIYFQQEPFPKNLIIARYMDTASSSANITGGTMATTVEDFNLITDGSFTMTIDPVLEYSDLPSTEYSVAGLDFSSDADFTAINATIKAGIDAAISAVAENVVVSLATSGSTIDMTAVDDTKILAVTSLTAGAVGTDISSMLSMTLDDGASYRYSNLAETISEAMDAVVGNNPSFTFICEDTDITDTDDVLELSSWAESNRAYMPSLSSFDGNVKLGLDNTKFYDLLQLEPSNTFGTYSATKDYKNVSAAARLSSVNFAQSNSMITMMFKVLGGTLPDSLTVTQANKIIAGGANFYSRRSGLPMFETGQTFDPDYWIDTKYWMIWFENAILTAVFNVLYRSGKVSQTEAGMSTIINAINDVCEQGKRNGGIAGGKLTAELTADVQNTTGNGDFDGVLADGYFVYSEPVIEQNQSDRNSRKAPPIKIWLKGAGAIHSVDIAIVLEQ